MKQYLFSLCAIIIGLLLQAPCFSQSREYPFRTFNVEDGLPQSYISGLVQDSEGFIWIGTRDGLARYDGKKFKVFRYGRGSKNSLSGNIINMMYLDNNDLLWIKHEHGEVEMLHTLTQIKKKVVLNEGSDTAGGRIKGRSSIATDASGKTWLLGDDNNGVYIVEKGKNRSYRHRSELLPGIADNRITGIATHGKQIILVTDSALVFLNTEGKIIRQVVHNFPNPSLYDAEKSRKDNSPVIRKNGEVIIPDLNRLIIYSPKTEAFHIVPLPEQKVYMAPPRLLDKQDNLYLAYSDRIFRLSTSNVLSELPLNAHRIADNLLITSMILGRSGVLWIGTNGYGLMQYDLRLNRVPKFEYRANFQEDILRLLNVSDGEIEKSFLRGMKPYNFRWTNGADGRLWICKANSNAMAPHNLCYYKDGGLTTPSWNYRGNTGEKYSLQALATDSKGRLWAFDSALQPICFDIGANIATTYNALFDGSKKFNRLVNVSGFTIDGNGIFWLSSNIGLIRYDHKNKVYSISLRGTNIMCVTQSGTEKNTLWVGTYSDGLIKYDKASKKAVYYTVEDGLPNNTVYSTIYDNSGNLWCSTNKGIFSFNPETKNVKKYTSKDGLPEDEFNSFAFFKFDDGRIAFGGTRGYTCFSPSQLTIDTFEPKTVITGISIDNEPANYSDPNSLLKQDINGISELRLPYDRNFLSFEFAALEYNIPEKITYRYKLEGLDEKWVMAGNSNVATYTAIPPGRYILIINATNTDGVWSSKLKRLSIIIQPPFWQTWWFISICTVGVICVIVVLVIQKLKNIRKQYRLRMSFERETMELEARALRSQMNPHFIFNCLSSINALIREDRKNEAVMYLNVFSRLIRNQLNNNLKEISLEDELETCRLYLQLESLRFGEKLDYNFVIDEHIDTSSMQVPPLILQPFIENAIIHGILPLEKTGRITVTVGQADGAVICCIDDNGIGRQKAEEYREQRRKKHVSHGTNLIASRISLHNRLNHHKIAFHIEDKADCDNNPLGTRVIIKLTADD